MLGRYFFHGGSLEVVMLSVECVDGAAAPMLHVSACLLQNSHVIRLDEDSIKSENVAIPTI